MIDDDLFILLKGNAERPDIQVEEARSYDLESPFSFKDLREVSGVVVLDYVYLFLFVFFLGFFLWVLVYPF